MAAPVLVGICDIGGAGKGERAEFRHEFGLETFGAALLIGDKDGVTGRGSRVDHGTDLASHEEIEDGGLARVGPARDGRDQAASACEVRDELIGEEIEPLLGTVEDGRFQFRIGA